MNAPKSSPAGGPDPGNRIWGQLADLERELHRIRRETRRRIETELSRFVGQSLPELAANRQLAATIHAMLDGNGLRVRCGECGHPAILRVSPRPGSRAGVFVFDHTIGGKRTFHGGGSRIPELRLVDKPPRRGGRRAAG